VNCERFREAASARLDGEPIGMPAATLDHHLTTCADCAGWLSAITAVGRSFRVSGQIPPDVSAGVLENVVLPVERVSRRRRWLRTGLAATGLVQWALAIPGLSGDSVGMHMAMHASHESAAWNLAVGASFIAVAVRPARALGAAPILGTFLAALAVLSLPDFVAGQVEVTRLASHGGVAIGLLLVVLLTRSNRLLPPPSTGTGDETNRETPGLRSVPSDPGRQGVA